MHPPDPAHPTVAILVSGPAGPLRRVTVALPAASAESTHAADPWDHA